MLFYDLFFCSFLLLVACVGLPTVDSYEAAMRFRPVIAVPRNAQGKPLYDQALLTTVSETWCKSRQRLRLPDGNEWKNENGFLCMEFTHKDMLTFQQLRKTGWQFRWNCTEKESACIIKN